MQKGFTLIELLVVVLIIGILSAIALPQYQKAVERTKMTEALVNIRAIANANIVYYLANNRYAEMTEMDLLDVDIAGTVVEEGWLLQRVATKDFLYSPNGDGNNFLALAKRIKNGDPSTNENFYMLYIPRNSVDRVRCFSYESAPEVMKKLCSQVDQLGTL